jgi:tetratricopeptide (TPR) repeat protein
MARARAGEAAGRKALLALLETPETPYWKASAVALLEAWGGEPAVRSAWVHQLTHEHPLVRYRAVQALGSYAEGGDVQGVAALTPLLRDPARAVRFSAGWALRGRAQPDGRLAAELSHMLALNADQPTGQAQRAVWEMTHGRLASAVEHYGRAVAWDPGSPGLRHDYAVALSLAGRSVEALRQTEAAVRLQPAVAENQYRLGLAWAEAGDVRQASLALAEAVRLDPRHGRAAYNLGLAYHQLGESERALEVLAGAEQVSPRDPAIPYAQATILAALGRGTEARAAVGRSLAIDPGFGPARELQGLLVR